jgi:hypothetical protein
MRELSHTVVHEWEKPIEGVGIALSPATEEIRDVVGEHQPVSVERRLGRSRGPSPILKSALAPSSIAPTPP